MSKILVVDDDEMARALLEAAFTAKGHEVIMAANGRDALTMVREKQPQLIILDVTMPKMDGFHLCRLIKYDTRFKHIPIIFTSALTSEADKKVGITCGGDTYVEKPFNIKALIDIVERYLSNHN